ncbi:MAG: hypothetical protein V1647_05880 [Pseudomonadota bacterium]
MRLSQTIEKAHRALTLVGIDHAVIGGVALANLGINRATADLDLLIKGENRDAAIAALCKEGFNLGKHTDEVLHFDGVGYLDILLANRPLSKVMLQNAVVIGALKIKCLLPEDIIGLKIQAYSNDPSRELQDKSDIKALGTVNTKMDMAKIKKYADLFNKWEEVKALLSR